MAWIAKASPVVAERIFMGGDRSWNHRTDLSDPSDRANPRTGNRESSLLRVRSGLGHVLLPLIHVLLGFARLVLVLRHLGGERVQRVFVLREELAVIGNGRILLRLLLLLLGPSLFLVRERVCVDPLCFLVLR